MPDENDPDDGNSEARIVRFPQSRVTPTGSKVPFKELGLSDLSRKLGLPERQATGHWCSRCRWIWYGYLLEVTCPVCGNRHG